MFILAIVLASALVSTETTDYCALAASEQPVPAYPASVQVFGSGGVVLTPQVKNVGEFASLHIKIRYIRHDVTWVPTTLPEAAYALRDMLPMKFYTRLVAGYDAKSNRLTMSSDSAVNERVGDVATFLNKTWGSKWNNGIDEYASLANIVGYLKTKYDALPQRCNDLNNLVVDNRRSVYPSPHGDTPVKISPTKDEGSESGIVIPSDKSLAVREFGKMMPRSYVKSLRISKVSGGLLCASERPDIDSYVISWIIDNWINYDSSGKLAKSYGVAPVGALYRDILAGRIMFSICEINK